MKKDLTELVFILDKSGSMSGLEKDTIGGYNSMLDKQIEVEGDCRLTTVLFDNEYKLLHDRIDIRAINKMTEKDYQVGGSTALLDAIGRSIHKIVNVQKQTAPEFRADKVMFVIITDGEENASREYSSEKIRELIERQKAQYGWEFIFLGANIDAIATASHFGIAADRAVDYLSDREGTNLNYKVMAEAVKTFRKSGTVDSSCFDEIRADVKMRSPGSVRTKGGRQSK